MTFVPIQQGTPGWQSAPVPSWGVNPLNAGPRRVGVGLGCPGGCGVGAEDTNYETTTWGHVAAAAAASLTVGLLIGWYAGKPKTGMSSNRGGVYRKMKPNRSLKRSAAAKKGAKTRKRRADLAKWSRSAQARSEMRSTRKATSQARYYDSGL
jgi:hypothetical protein